jgi:UDP-N-acetylglucosamine acyltransferase
VPQVHPSAVVDPRAKLAESVDVGPHCVVGPDVEFGENVVLQAHVVVMGHTSVGAGTRLFPFACLGGEPQDKGFAGETTRLAIGRNNVIRENVTIHVGTPKGGGCTRLGNDNLLMVNSHIGHDCQLGSEVIVCASAGLAGHVTVGDHAVLGSFCGVHQFSRVGESVMIAANAMVSKDAPPFAMVAGDRARFVGLNSVGIRRRGFSDEAVSRLKRAYHLLYHSKLRLEPALERVREEVGEAPEVQRLLAFLEKSERGFIR